MCSSSFPDFVDFYRLNALSGSEYQNLGELTEEKIQQSLRYLADPAFDNGFLMRAIVSCNIDLHFVLQVHRLYLLFQTGLHPEEGWLLVAPYLFLY